MLADEGARGAAADAAEGQPLAAIIAYAGCRRRHCRRR